MTEFIQIVNLNETGNYYNKYGVDYDYMEEVLEICYNYGRIILYDDRTVDHETAGNVFRIGGKEFTIEEVKYAFVYDSNGYELYIVEEGKIRPFDFWLNRRYGWLEDNSVAREFWVCPECNSVFYAEEHEPSECPECGYGPKSIRNLLSFYHEAKGTFRKESPEKAETVLHMGFELETDTGGLHADINGVLNAIEELSGIPQIADLEEDGSLGELGFEIISHPLTVPTMKRLAEKICETAENNGVGLTSNCGLHFHLDLGYLRNGENGGYYLAKHNRIEPKYNRMGLNDYAKAKVHAFVTALYNDGTTNMEIIDRRSGRYGYCRPQTKDKADCETSAPKTVRLVEKSRREGRYDVVNVQNHDTAELRFFAATLEPFELLADIDIAAAIAEYSRTHEIFDLEDTTTDEFFGYIEKNAETYPDAAAYLKDFEFDIA